MSTFRKPVPSFPPSKLALGDATTNASATAATAPMMAFPMLMAISGFVTERWGRFDGNRVIPSLALPEQIVPSTVNVMASERMNSKLPSSEVEPAAALEVRRVPREGEGREDRT